MADPTTIISGIGLGISALGALTGAFGAVTGGEAQGQQFEAQARQATYQRGVALMNQRIAKQNADYSRSVGEVEAQTEGMKTRAVVGATKAHQAASGIDLETGSAADVRESESAIGAENVAVIRSNAARQAYGYEVEASKDVAQAGLFEAAAEDSTRAAGSARTAGTIGAVSSILGGASSVSSRWLQGNQVGLWGDTTRASGRPRVGPFPV